MQALCPLTAGGRRNPTAGQCLAEKTTSIDMHFLTVYSILVMFKCYNLILSVFFAVMFVLPVVSRVLKVFSLAPVLLQLAEVVWPYSYNFAHPSYPSSECVCVCVCLDH